MFFSNTLEVRTLADHFPLLSSSLPLSLSLLSNLARQTDFYSRLNSPFADGQSIRVPLSGFHLTSEHGVRQYYSQLYLTKVAILATVYLCAYEAAF